MNQTTQSAKSNGAQPWWKFGHVWMLVAGPAIVVVASMITLYLAISRPDPVMDENYYQKGIELNKTLGGNASSLAPAMQARNHAQTGVPKPINAP
jgi:hypothetical protein